MEWTNHDRYPRKQCWKANQHAPGSASIAKLQMGVLSAFKHVRLVAEHGEHPIQGRAASMKGF